MRVVAKLTVKGGCPTAHLLVRREQGPVGVHRCAFPDGSLDPNRGLNAVVDLVSTVPAQSQRSHSAVTDAAQTQHSAVTVTAQSQRSHSRVTAQSRSQHGSHSTVTADLDRHPGDVTVRQDREVAPTRGRFEERPELVNRARHRIASTGQHAMSYSDGKRSSTHRRMWGGIKLSNTSEMVKIKPKSSPSQEHRAVEHRCPSRTVVWKSEQPSA